MKEKGNTTPVDDMEEKFLEEVSKSSKIVVTFQRKVFFFFLALLTSFIPSYLFQNIFDLKFEGRALWILFSIVVFFSAKNLYQGYKVLYLKNKKKLSKSYGKKLEGTNTSEDEKEKNIEFASLGKTIWVSNAIYTFLVLIFGIYFLREYDSRVIYAVTLPGSAFVTKSLVSRKARKKKNRKKLFP